MCEEEEEEEGRETRGGRESQTTRKKKKTSPLILVPHQVKPYWWLSKFESREALVRVCEGVLAALVFVLVASVSFPV